jgi:hypothetical protein
MSIIRLVHISLLITLTNACDLPGSHSNGGITSTGTADIGVYPPSASSLTASVEPGPFHPFLPIGLQITVRNATASSLEVPLLLLGAGLVKVSVITPSGESMYLPGQGSQDFGGKLTRALAPGEGMTEVITLSPSYSPSGHLMTTKAACSATGMSIAGTGVQETHNG